MNLLFFTGTDSKMLPQSFILLQSLQEVAADAELVFCDFGLTAPQKRFLERRYQVAVIPPMPKNRAHPWLRKASLIDFMGHGTEVAVWIDADMLLLSDPRAELATIIDQMADENQSLAA